MQLSRAPPVTSRARGEHSAAETAIALGGSMLVCKFRAESLDEDGFGQSARSVVDHVRPGGLVFWHVHNSGANT